MQILSKLPERLQELMADKNLSPKELAARIGINRNTITRYLQGVRLPSFATFIKLLDELNCSADFLIGLIDYPTENQNFLPTPTFAERFRALLTEHKMSQYALHHKTNLSFDDFDRWLKGTHQPYIDNLIKLAEAFNCSVDYLLGRIL